MTSIITGIAGFIGSNLAARLIQQGQHVVGIDNISRKGSRENLDRLKAIGPFEFEQGDIKDDAFLMRVFARHRDARAVYHLAGQVAVTTSVVDPRADFNSNALGTFNVLEAIRLNRMDPAIIYASTNKVYGKMSDMKIVERNNRYEYADHPQGVSEERGLDFHSPYGCSKGAGDQYMIDYARIFGLKTVTFRQSCIYGYNQFGIEDQGWVAWFTIAALMNKPMTIYGDGKQVRDVLFIEDLLDAYETAVTQIDTCRGQVFNVGGGPDNTMSLLELLDILERRMGRRLQVTRANWRPGDQKVFVCDISRIRRTLGWSPKVGVEEGVKRLYDWSAQNVDLFRRILG